MAIKTIVIILCEVIIGVLLTQLTKHQVKREAAVASASWAIIDGEFLLLNTEEEA